MKSNSCNKNECITGSSTRCPILCAINLLCFSMFENTMSKRVGSWLSVVPGVRSQRIWNKFFSDKTDFSTYFKAEILNIHIFFIPCDLIPVYWFGNHRKMRKNRCIKLKSLNRYENYFAKWNGVTFFHWSTKIIQPGWWQFLV